MKSEFFSHYFWQNFYVSRSKEKKKLHDRYTEIEYAIKKLFHVNKIMHRLSYIHFYQCRLTLILV